MQNETTELTDILTPELVLVRAGSGQRLANYIIDLVTFYVVIFLLAIVITIFSPSTIVDAEAGWLGSPIVGRIFYLFLYALYMSGVEAIFKGKTLGKLITRTRAVNFDGSKISTGTAFARGFSRAVPFNPLSALGSPCIPWHDKWTDTVVIDEKESQLL